jgi:hypothetical protein
MDNKPTKRDVRKVEKLICRDRLDAVEYFRPDTMDAIADLLDRGYIPQHGDDMAIEDCYMARRVK